MSEYIERENAINKLSISDMLREELYNTLLGGVSNV